MWVFDKLEVYRKENLFCLFKLAVLTYGWVILAELDTIWTVAFVLHSEVEVTALFTFELDFFTLRSHLGSPWVFEYLYAVFYPCILDILKLNFIIDFLKT